MQDLRAPAGRRLGRPYASALLRAPRARALTRSASVLALLVLAGTPLAWSQAADPARQDANTPSAPSSPSSPPQGAAPGDIVARVNGAPIRRLDLDEAIAAFRRDNDIPANLTEEQSRQMRDAVMEGLIGSVLLYQMALTIPIEVPQADVDVALKNARRSMGEEEYHQDLARRRLSETDMEALVRQNLTVQKLIQETVMNRTQVGDAEIRAFYDKNADGMVRPEAVDASIIVVKSTPADPAPQREEARRRIQQAVERLKAGEPFGDVARSLSEDGTASGGGALGWVPRGVMIPEIETPLFALEAGQVSGIVETSMGLHVLKVASKRPSGRMSLEEARPGIAEILKQQKSAETLQRMVVELRAAARIEIF